MGFLNGKLALITGSTSGIGLGIAKALAKEGADLVLNGFGDPNEINQLVISIADEFKVSVTFHGADLSKVEEIEEMMAGFAASRPLDILINNAGIQYVSPVEDFPVARWNAIMNINLNAVFHTTRLAIPHMRRTNWGRIINIASTHGLVASPNKSAYVASKHAVVGFTKSVALETAKTAITANCVCPGWVLTPLVQKQIEDRAVAEGITVEEAKLRLISEKQPSGVPVSVEQLGALVVFLASDAASEVRGAAWNMDGGWVAV